MGRQVGANLSQGPLAKGSRVAILLKGTVLAFLVSLVLLFIASLVLHFTSVPESVTPYLVFVISLVAVLSGSIYAGKRIRYKGWLHGGLVGLLYVILMLAVGLLILDDVAAGWHFITKLFLGFVFGSVGGMWGVNS